MNCITESNFVHLLTNWQTNAQCGKAIKGTFICCLHSYNKIVSYLKVRLAWKPRKCCYLPEGSVGMEPKGSAWKPKCC